MSEGEVLAWHATNGRTPTLSPTDLVFVRGRLGDIYGPVPVEIISFCAWRGNMFHAAHDLTHYALAENEQ